jgi:hypothetical protein
MISWIKQGVTYEVNIRGQCIIKLNNKNIGYIKERNNLLIVTMTPLNKTDSVRATMTPLNKNSVRATNTPFEFISHSVPNESGLDESKSSRIEIIENDENNSERQVSGSKERNEPLNDEEINQPDEEEIAEIKEEENSSIDSNDSREQNTSVQQEKQPNRGLDQAVIEDEFNKFVDTIVKDNQERLKGKRFNAEKQAKLDAPMQSVLTLAAAISNRHQA